MNKYESTQLFARLEEFKDLLTKIEANTRPKKRGRPRKMPKDYSEVTPVKSPRKSAAQIKSDGEAIVYDPALNVIGIKSKDDVDISDDGAKPLLGDATKSKGT